MTTFEELEPSRWTDGENALKMSTEDISISYTQNSSHKSLKAEKICYRSITTSRYGFALCYLVTQGTYLFSSDEVKARMQLSTSHKPVILAEIAIIWSSPAEPEVKLLTFDDKNRARRQDPPLTAYILWAQGSDRNKFLNFRPFWASVFDHKKFLVLLSEKTVKVLNLISDIKK